MNQIKSLFVISFLAIPLVLLTNPKPALAVGQWTVVGSTQQAHGSSNMITLQNGKVMIVSGPTTCCSISSVAEIYNEATNQWNQTGSVSLGRDQGNVVLLQDGKVLFAGGTVGGTSGFSNADLYDPTTGQWTATDNMNTSRRCASYIRLQDGRVLASSGIPGDFNALSSSELYDPTTGHWTYTGDVVNPVWDCNSQSVLLNDGHVLMVGNALGDSSTIAQLYDPTSGTWAATGSLVTSRFNTTLIKLQDGRILLIGGDQWGNSGLAESELYDPSTGQWSLTGSLNQARTVDNALLLSDGRVFVAGGVSDSGNVLSSEIYDPSTGQWSLDASLHSGHGVGRIAMLTNGKILIAGGWDNGSPTPATEVYSFVSNNAPTIAPLSDSSISEGQTFSTSGSFTDADSSSWTASVDYGDGSGVQPLPLTAQSFTLNHLYSSAGTYNVVVSVTDDQSAVGTSTATITVIAPTPTPTPTPVQITSVNPAKVWVGLANSDDVGVKFDLKAEVYKDNTLITSGQTDSVAAGSSGFNNAKLDTILFNSFSPVAFPSGSQLKIAVYVRNACIGSGHNAGKARLWYNDSQASSNFGATIGSNASTYYLLNNLLLGTNVGSGPKKTVDIQSGAKCSAFKPFGTWTITP
jgi:hypothetical protein